ncbi:MAG: lactonase family protein, partial [Limisphaerales bacterium]
VHPSGKFVYGSNRGHDSIVVFRVNEKTGELALAEHQSTQGKVPRHFEIDPSGNYLFAANQDSGTVVIFRIDPKTGRLNSIGQTIEVETPQCVKFVPLAEGPL